MEDYYALTRSDNGRTQCTPRPLGVASRKIMRTFEVSL